MEKGTHRQAISLLEPNENSERCVNHRTSHSDRDSERESPTAKRASCLWAFHHMTLSRSRLLILSDLSLKSCNRVVTVKYSQGREWEPLKVDCLRHVSTPSLDTKNMFSFGGLHGAPLTAASPHLCTHSLVFVP